MPSGVQAMRDEFDALGVTLHLPEPERRESGMWAVTLDAYDRQRATSWTGHEVTAYTRERLLWRVREHLKRWVGLPVEADAR